MTNTQPLSADPLDLAPIQAREAAATKGPWHVLEDQATVTRWVTNDSETLELSLGYIGNRTESDAQFVAHARQDVPDLLAELVHLRTENEALRLGTTAAVATAKATGYRQAADNATEMVQLHGRDADAEMLLVGLRRGAELREQAAAQATWSDRECGCSARFDRHADGCTAVAPATAEDEQYPARLGVYCDTCHTTAEGDFVVSDAMTKPERLELIRAHVRTLGWSCTAAGDYCPTCAPTAA
ncbi:hypothetical protein F4556_002382 [Kitasatospora gansuensis]|uniref:Uncharacterized protein n=1 Tax=Kitasatospora gansuensis TaxID=258050 RepID=A0A7W7SAS4_9ACTN|nr:hypothetical protein [Kitasatospora gansuensis]MBB4946847.1 hypothetical protein [Kitasatospora gansuensis]